MHTVQHKDETDVVVEPLRPFGTTIFTEMTVLADKHGAVNLSQGFPDFDGPEEIRRRAAEALIRGPNQYAPSTGIGELRHAVARKMKRFYDVDVDPENEITVTAGSTEGLCSTLLGILEPGDEIILLEPSYDSYAPVAALARAKIVHVSLSAPDFSLPRDKLARAFNAKTKAILVNNPQNPCGKVYSREELEFIASLCVEHDALILGDEVYEHLVYDGRQHNTLLGLPELRDRAFVISSTAKTFSMTGWKIGYVISAPELSRAVRMSHQFITFCGQSALQEAMAFGIDFSDKYYRNLLKDYTKRRDLLCGALIDMGLDAYVPEGAYFAIVNIESLGFDDDVSFCTMLIKEAGVAVIPCSSFWNNRSAGRNLVRFCFCKKDETLHEAIQRLRRWRG